MMKEPNRFMPCLKQTLFLCLFLANQISAQEINEKTFELDLPTVWMDGDYGNSSNLRYLLREVGDLNPIVVSYGEDLNPNWIKRLESEVDYSLTHMTNASNGDIILAGRINSIESANSANPLIISISDTGLIQWIKVIELDNNSIVNGIDALPNGGVRIACFCGETGFSNVIWIDSSGSLIESREFSSENGNISLSGISCISQSEYLLIGNYVANNTTSDSSKLFVTRVSNSLIDWVKVFEVGFSGNGGVRLLLAGLRGSDVAARAGAV
ncbi:MAG: hypothetical protein AAGC47_06195, partial [Bacteroidota bacterium]